MAKAPPIASVSVGETRRFQLTHKTRRDLVYGLDLQDGSLLLMVGTTQRYWLHQVPKTTKLVGERVNLTFRVVGH
jgi:alkylated DNA repair dioxygenase AlkB